MDKNVVHCDSDNLSLFLKLCVVKMNTFWCTEMQWKQKNPSVTKHFASKAIDIFILSLLLNNFIYQHVKQTCLHNEETQLNIYPCITFPSYLSKWTCSTLLAPKIYCNCQPHLFHLQPSRCVWACEWAEGCECFNAVCGLWKWTTLHLNISYLLASGDDEQVGGESTGNSEL